MEEIYNFFANNGKIKHFLEIRGNAQHVSFSKGDGRLVSVNGLWILS